jgi:hypothetical protein
MVDYLLEYSVVWQLALTAQMKPCLTLDPSGHLAISVGDANHRNWFLQFCASLILFQIHFISCGINLRSEQNIQPYFSLHLSKP